MKKVLAVSSVLLGVVFLAGCGLQPVSQTQPTTPAPAAQTPTTPANTQNYVEVKELGFKIPVDASMVGELTYKINSGGGVVFSSKALTAANKFCGDGASGAGIAKIQGTPATPKSGDPVFYKAHISDTKQFDGFFLFYQGPQDSCTMGKNVDLEKKVSQAVADGFKNATLTPEEKQTANCVNEKFGYQLTYPTGWKVWTVGAGEARSATCSENLAAYFFAKDFGAPSKNQINLIVSTRDNQDKEFWQGINSLDDYVKSLSAWKIQKETTINGERLTWLKYNQELELVAYHNSAIYEFSIYSVDSITLDKFLASFEFTK